MKENTIDRITREIGMLVDKENRSIKISIFMYI